MVEYVSGLPNVVVDISSILALLDNNATNTVLHVNTDPVTGVAMFQVYTDDRHGNGTCILAIPVAELREIDKRLNIR